MTSSWFFRQGAFHAIFWLPILKGRSDFILVLHCNYTSIVHRFRFIELFVFAENDVIAISSLWGASGIFWLRILKGRPQFYIHVQLKFLAYLKRFRRYSTFLFRWDFPTGGEIVGILGKMIPKTSIERKTLAGRALPYAKLRRLSVKLSLSVWPVQVRKKKRQAGRQEELRSHKKCIFHVCVERSLADGFQPNLAIMFVSRTKLNVQSFLLLERLRRCWNFHVAIGNQGRP